MFMPGPKPLKIFNQTEVVVWLDLLDLLYYYMKMVALI